ncbi:MULTISPECIES: F0F1 ATP synthase subunit epsilon [Cohnella]|uniref:F0F1 ATP synthase subunit epsilon n=1 Tax=Cohnella TaxID=329857 RepID=UPI00037667F8|nr:MULTISPECIES: F0F1 ATP synthase subunit epsilon [Cohnella]REK66539.1 MAG: F0F1 ATP synthase subunit epsilon [Cohnella sp.]
MSTLRLDIVTPERKIYEQDVDMVIVQGVEGELGILPNHIPLVSPLKIAVARVKKGNQEEWIAVHGGFVEVRKDKVVILAEAAEVGSDIDQSRALQAKERAERRLANKQEQYDVKRAELALQRAMTRLQAASKS